MKQASVLILLLISSLSISFAQSESDSFYYQIPEAPEEFTPYTVAARVIDGLGFRYYWATEGLRPEDISFRPGEESRTTGETIDHILSLTTVVLNSIKAEVNSFSDYSILSFEEKRAKTLDNIRQARELVLAAEANKSMDDYAMTFARGENTVSYPFWNVLNGPLADALWHVGQVVSYRRLSGNPFDSQVSLLQGKRRD